MIEQGRPRPAADPGRQMRFTYCRIDLRLSFPYRDVLLMAAFLITRSGDASPKDRCQSIDDNQLIYYRGFVFSNQFYQ